MHKKQQKMQIKNANKNHFLDVFVCISIAYRTLQRSVRVALNNQDILDVLLREAGSLGGVEVLEGREGPLHLAGDDGGIGHVGSGVGIHPFEVLLRPAQHLGDLLHLAEATVLLQNSRELLLEGLQDEGLLQLLDQLHALDERDPLLQGINGLDELGEVGLDGAELARDLGVLEEALRFDDGHAVVVHSLNVGLDGGVVRRVVERSFKPSPLPCNHWLRRQGDLARSCKVSLPVAALDKDLLHLGDEQVHLRIDDAGHLCNPVDSMSQAGAVKQVREELDESTGCFAAICCGVGEEELDAVVVEVTAHEPMQSLDDGLLQGDVVVVDDVDDVDEVGPLECLSIQGTSQDRSHRAALQVCRLIHLDEQILVD